MTLATLPRQSSVSPQSPADRSAILVLDLACVRRPRPFQRTRPRWRLGPVRPRPSAPPQIAPRK